jgi:transposase
LLHQLSPDGEVLNFCYEAGPCGYEVYHQLTKLGQSCSVVAPSLIPRMPGVRIKTDRRDAMSFPRVCGDRPRERPEWPAARQFPPRMRG